MKEFGEIRVVEERDRENQAAQQHQHRAGAWLAIVAQAARTIRRAPPR
jgi:hypothetical protein